MQRAQQLGLQHERQLAQFIEKKRAMIGELEQADAPAVGAGERAALVAEKFALQQTLGNRAAIDRNEWTLRRTAAAMNAAGDQFLARAGFAAHEHVDVGVGNLLNQVEDPAHRPGSLPRCRRSCRAAPPAAAAVRTPRRYAVGRAIAGRWRPGCRRAVRAR